MALHEVQLKGYSVRPGNLSLGTYDSYGIEQLHVTLDDTWSGLAIDATFHNTPNDKGVTMLVDADGLVTVPPEACKQPSKYATITFRGVQDGVQRISCNLPYMVLDHAQVPGANSTATPSEIAQALAQMQGLRDGAVDAKNQAEAARDDAAKSAVAAKESEASAGQSATAAANSATAAAGSATAAAGDAKTASDAAAGAKDAKAAAVAAQKDAAASKAAAANSSAAAKTSEDAAAKSAADAAAKSAADADSTANSIKESMTQIAANKEAVSQLKEDTTALQKRQNVLVGSETGNPVSCNDAYSAPLCGLNVYGKSTQDGTPTPDAPVPIVSAGDSGSVAVKVTGKNLFYEQEFQEYFINSVANTVGLATGNVSCVLQVVTGAKYYVTRSKIGDKFRAAVVDKLPTSGNPVTPSSGINADSKRQIEISATSKYMVIQCEDEAAFSELMVSLDSSTAYSPYREQLLTLLTPNGLPGIPVTSGGNYTDPQGQQWVCDEVDLERGVKVQRVNAVDLSTCVITGTTNLVATKRLSIRLPLKGKDYTAKALCNRLPYLVSFTSDTIHFYVDTNNAQVFIPIGAKNPEEGEYILFYVLDAPIETPLTPAEIAAYKAITAYAPDTVVQASDGAGVKLEYQRDVNIAIKKLEDAIASMTAT